MENTYSQCENHLYVIVSDLTHYHAILKGLRNPSRLVQVHAECRSQEKSYHQSRSSQERDEASDVLEHIDLHPLLVYGYAEKNQDKTISRISHTHREE